VDEGNLAGLSGVYTLSGDRVTGRPRRRGGRPSVHSCVRENDGDTAVGKPSRQPATLGATQMPATHNSDILMLMARKSPFRNSLLALLLAGILSWACPAILAQEKPTVVTIVPDFSWQLQSSANVDPSVLAQWGGDPAIEREYGVTTLTARTYGFQGHAADVLVEVASDPSAAYGLWTFYRTAQMTPVHGMLLTVAGPGNALLVRGATFIRISLRGQETLPVTEDRALLKSVGGPPPSARSFEQLPPPLPSHALIRGSEKYILGPLAAARELPSLPTNLFGFDQGAEVQAAEYSVEGAGALTLAAINYPTPQIAVSAFDSINKSLSQNAASKISARRQDTYVLMVVNAPSRAMADRFLDQFKVSKVISQDPTNTNNSADVVGLMKLLIANGILVIALAAFSLFGGLLVFVSKRLARKWFSDSLLVQGEQGGMILLNLRWP
jgi:hypothetical protein